MDDEPKRCCPFCFHMGLPACVYISGCWYRATVERPADMTLEREHEMLATMLYYTRRPRDDKVDG